jgi:glucan phosphoethanolaminetransferase (alkaline phosphatase superfamily)
MHTKLIRPFTDSAAALLAAFVTVLVIGNVASAKLVQPQDPLLAISMRTLFWILGAVAMAVVLVAIFMRQPRFKLALILWFTTNLIVYRMGLQWQGVHNIRGYVGSLAHTFELSTSFTNSLLNLLFLYLFAGSAGLLLWNFLVRPEAVPLKAICAHCGGHIAFSAQNLGQKIPCPHCKAAITLRKSYLLKMSCFFCQGHIEFPAHAIGEKMPCPHCQMDITLKAPA